MHLIKESELPLEKLLMMYKYDKKELPTTETTVEAQKDPILEEKSIVNDDEDEEEDDDDDYNGEGIDDEVASEEEEEGENEANNELYPKYKPNKDLINLINSNSIAF